MFAGRPELPAYWLHTMLLTPSGPTLLGEKAGVYLTAIFRCLRLFRQCDVLSGVKK